MTTVILGEVIKKKYDYNIKYMLYNPIYKPVNLDKTRKTIKLLKTLKLADNPYGRYANEMHC